MHGLKCFILFFAVIGFPTRVVVNGSFSEMSPSMKIIYTKVSGIFLTEISAGAQ